MCFYSAAFDIRFASRLTFARLDQALIAGTAMKYQQILRAQKATGLGFAWGPGLQIQSEMVSLPPYQELNGV